MKEILHKLCSVSSDWYSRGNVSRTQLVNDSGASSCLAKLTVTAVAQFLESKPELMDSWEQETEDIRGTPAWFFQKRPSNDYVVGFIGRDGETEVSAHFMRRTEACAMYILSSLADLLGIEPPISQQTPAVDAHGTQPSP